jgi:hypothetical protein
MTLTPESPETNTVLPSGDSAATRIERDDLIHDSKPAISLTLGPAYKLVPGMHMPGIPGKHCPGNAGAYQARNLVASACRYGSSKGHARLFNE